MELALSLGDPSKSFSFLDKTPKLTSKDLGFCMGLRLQEKVDAFEGEAATGDGDYKWVSSDPPHQLDLLPFSPVPRVQPSSELRFTWLTDNGQYFLTYFPLFTSRFLGSDNKWKKKYQSFFAAKINYLNLGCVGLWRKYK